jgi:NTE family protein
VTRRLGLALGGGGVRGFAHVGVLELLDEMGLRPSVIAGTSMGAVIGALYAAGLSGRSLRSLAREYSIQDGDTLRDVVRKRSHLAAWLRALVPERRGGLISIDRFLVTALEPLRGLAFADLRIPLLVVATDFWTAEEVVIEGGGVMEAVRASMAIPGVFAPVLRDGRVLVDGGLVNRVPYDHLKARCDVTVAVDVIGDRHADSVRVPNVIEASAGALDIMQRAAFDLRLSAAPPDILVRAPIHGIPTLGFTRIGEVLHQAEPAVAALRDELLSLTSGTGVCA